MEAKTVLEWQLNASCNLLTELIERTADDEWTERPAKEVWGEIESLNGIPAWQLLARPSMSHIRVHYGEVGVQLQVLAGLRRLKPVTPI